MCVREIPESNMLAIVAYVKCLNGVLLKTCILSGKTISESVPGPSATTDPSWPKTMVLGNSIIKEYHAYQIKPPNTYLPAQLKVDREYTLWIKMPAECGCQILKYLMRACMK